MKKNKTEIEQTRNVDIINISTEMFQEADNARKPVENIWNKVYDLYNNKYDFSKKEDWQSKNYVPKISNAVNAIVGFLKKAVISKREWFSTEALEKKYEEYEVSINNLIKYWLEKNKFVEIFGEGLIAGLLSNLIIFKVFWRNSEILNETVLPDKAYQTDIIKDKGKKENPFVKLLMETSQQGITEEKILEKDFYEVLANSQKQDLRISIIDPYDFYIDPTGKNKYCIHRSYMDLSDLKNVASSSGFDVEEINKISEDFKRQEARYKEDVRKGMNPSVSKPSYRKQIEILEFWGDLYDENGNILYQNCTWTVANDRYLIRKPTKNPFWHQKFPFVWGPLVKKPFSVYHKNYFEDSLGLAFALTELLNLMLDINSFATAKAFEIDLDILADPEDLVSGLYPAKVLKKRAGGTNANLIKEVSLGTMSPQILRIYQEMDREYQNSARTTEFLLGKPSTRGRPTATEVTIKTQQSSAAIEEVASDVEENVLAPLLQMILVLCLQYQRNFDDMRLFVLQEEIVDKIKILAALDEKEKKQIVNIFNFKVRGLSGIVSKQANLEKLLTFIKFIGDTPAVEYIDFKKLMKKVLNNLELDEEDILLSDEEIELNQKKKIMMQMLAQQGQKRNINEQGGQNAI